MLWGAQELSVMRPFPSFGLIPKVRAGQWIPVPWHLSSQFLCICAPTYIHIFVHISMDTQTLQAREDVDYRRNSIAICQVPLSGLVRIFYYYFCSALVGGHPNEREEGKPELCTSQRWQWKHLCSFQMWSPDQPCSTLLLQAAALWKAFHSSDCFLYAQERFLLSAV